MFLPVSVGLTEYPSPKVFPIHALGLIQAAGRVRAYRLLIPKLAPLGSQERREGGNMYRVIPSTVMLSGAACLFVIGILGLRGDNTADSMIRVQLDGGGDRQVIPAEDASAFPKPAPGQFDTRDTNADGHVSLEEAQTVEPKLTLQEFMDRDITGDGLLTPEECPSAGPAAPHSLETESIPSVEG